MVQYFLLPNLATVVAYRQAKIVSLHGGEQGKNLVLVVMSFKAKLASHI